MLVTGATGNTGGATLKAVQKLGAPVRVLVRDPSRFQASDGVEVANQFVRGCRITRCGTGRRGPRISRRSTDVKTG